MKFLEAKALAEQGRSNNDAQLKAPQIEDKMLRLAGSPEGRFSPPESDNAEESAERSASAEVKALAEKLGVDLTTVKGTGKDGRVLLRDVRAAVAQS